MSARRFSPQLNIRYEPIDDFLNDAVDCVGDEGEPHQEERPHEDKDGEDLQGLH